MEITCELEILEIFSLNPFCESNISSSVIYTDGMRWIVIWVCFTLAENIEDIGTSLVEEMHRVDDSR
jgi:hypothetical protein